MTPPRSYGPVQMGNRLGLADFQVSRALEADSSRRRTVAAAAVLVLAGLSAAS